MLAALPLNLTVLYPKATETLNEEVQLAGTLEVIKEEAVGIDIDE